MKKELKFVFAALTLLTGLTACNSNDDGVTELYALDEFSPRKTENIRKGYLQGRYGAVPNIGWEDLKW